MNEKLLELAKEKAFDIHVYEGEYSHYETEYTFSESGIVALLELVTKLFATPTTYKGREAEALLCMTQQRNDLLRDLGHASLTDVGLNALDVTEAKLKIAIEALQGLIASVKGYRKNIRDNQPCDAEVFAEQALEKIGE